MTDTPDARTPLEDIQDELLDRLHAGEPIDRPAVLARHPQHAEALRRFFSLLDVIEVPADPAAAPPGRLGEFEILREIGRGGMGVVYEARQASLNRNVALKVLPPALRSDRRLLTRFQREAEAAARLRHPNIVPVYSIGESAGAPFFAMELVEGRSLAHVIRARREGGSASLPTEPDAWRAWCVGVAALIADALDYAHGRGILHRDIKPANILLESDGVPRLTDFGLALDMQASELTRTGEVFGSPLYMSPEQAFRRDQPVDARTDIYSLAVTLFELLTLRLPYLGTSHAELMSALSTGRTVDPRSVDPDMPEPLARVISQALRMDPHERYATAAAFGADLRAALEEPERVQAIDRSALAGAAAGAAAPATDGGRTSLAADGPAGQRAHDHDGRLRFRDRHPTLAHPVVGCLLLVVVALMLAGTVFMIRQRSQMQAGEQMAGAPVQDGDRPIVSSAPTAAQLRGLADGTLSDGQQVLAAWLQPDFQVRGVVERGGPGPCRFELALMAPDVVDDGLVLNWSCALFVDGERVPMPGDAGPVLLAPVGTGSLTFARSFPLASVLDDALMRDAIRVRPVITMGVGRLGPTGVTRVVDPGTERVWTGPERTLFVYDEYPSDYPELVSDPESDRIMAAVLTPDSVRAGHQVSAGGAPGARGLQLTLAFDPAPRGPLPSAMDVVLLPVDDDRPLGHATLSTQARSTAPDGTGTITLEFELTEPPSAGEQRLLLALEAGTLDAVRLRMTPSRDAALAEPGFDRYWGGSLDVVVPVER